MCPLERCIIVTDRQFTTSLLLQIICGRVICDPILTEKYFPCFSLVQFSKYLFSNLDYFRLKNYSTFLTVLR